MAEITASTTGKRKKSLSSSRNHRSTRVDLTPMVDLGFLLITFFVFTTTMAEPKAMDLMQTHNGDPIDTKESAVMTIMLSKGHEIYYYEGKLPEVDKVSKTDFKNIRTLIVNKKNVTDTSYLMYIIKADEDATFGDSINLLDEMAICNVKTGHYAEVDITKEETELIKSKRSKK